MLWVPFIPTGSSRSHARCVPAEGLHRAPWTEGICSSYLHSYLKSCTENALIWDWFGISYSEMNASSLWYSGVQMQRAHGCQLSEQDYEIHKSYKVFAFVTGSCHHDSSSPAGAQGLIRAWASIKHCLALLGGTIAAAIPTSLQELFTT